MIFNCIMSPAVMKGSQGTMAESSCQKRHLRLCKAPLLPMGIPKTALTPPLGGWPKLFRRMWHCICLGIPDLVKLQAQRMGPRAFPLEGEQELSSAIPCRVLCTRKRLGCQQDPLPSSIQKDSS